MIQKIKAFINKHRDALHNEVTSENEKQAITNGFKNVVLKLFHWIIILGISYVILAPVFGIVASSFFSNSDSYNPMVYLLPQAPTLERYETVISIMDYWNTMGKSLFYTISLMAIQVFICSMVGYGFARFKFPFKKLLFGCVVVMIVIPTHTIMLPLYMTFRNFNPLGLVELILGEGKSINLMSTWWPMYIMTLFGAGLRSGLYIYIFNQFFRGLPKEIEEAALVDGAGSWYTYFFIMLRNATPSVITVAVFAMVWQYNDTFFARLFSFDTADNIGMRIGSVMGSVANQLKIMDRVIQELYLDAAIVLMIVPILLVYIFLQKYFIEGVERSGIVG